MPKPLMCGACGETGQYWDGNCEAVLCAWCVPKHDEYVIPLSKYDRPRRPRQPGELTRRPRWRTP